MNCIIVIVCVGYYWCLSYLVFKGHGLLGFGNVDAFTGLSIQQPVERNGKAQWRTFYSKNIYNLEGSTL